MNDYLSTSMEDGGAYYDLKELVFRFVETGFDGYGALKNPEKETEETLGLNAVGKGSGRGSHRRSRGMAHSAVSGYIWFRCVLARVAWTATNVARRNTSLASALWEILT